MTDTEMILDQLKKIENRIDGIQGQMDSMQEKIDGMQGQMDSMQEKMDGMQGQINGLDNKFESFKSDMLNELQKQTDTLNEKSAEIDRHLHETEHNLKVYMENAVGSRVTALMEGFEINRDNIARNMRFNRRLQEQVDDLSTRVAVLESKTSA